MILNKIDSYIDKHQLLHKEALYLVALSGGADSVCLLLAMLSLGYRVHAVHCNFHLRGAESDRDETFCKQLCREHGVPISLTHFDTKAYASLHKVSIEMAARTLRYDYFEQLRVSIGAEAILVAHHREDNVETVLMNIVRGTGLSGLEGIKPRNGHILRPLLCVSRREIEDFLAARQQSYVTDSTNLVDDIARNKMRLNIIPQLKEINPAVVQNIERLTRYAAEARQIVDAYERESVAQCTQTVADDGGETVRIDIEKLMSLTAPEQTLYAVLSRYGFTSQQIEHIYNNVYAPVGRTWQSATHTVAVDRGCLLVGESVADDDDKELRVPETGLYVMASGSRLRVEQSVRTDDFTPSKQPFCVTIDADKVHFPLTVRRIKAGDRFSPFGMKGSQLCSDYLTNKKIDYFRRRRQLVVEDATGVIVWLIGERTSQKVSCGKNTINILSLRYNNDET